MPDESADRARDLAKSRFVANRPNCLRVADFTFISIWWAVIFNACLIDMFNRKLDGWRASKIKKTDFVLDALEHVIYAREADDGLEQPDKGAAKIIAIVVR